MTAIGRAGFDKVKTKGRDAAPFEIRYQNGKGPEVLRADAVIDATGTWFSPNPAGANGLPAVGEHEAQDRIAYGMPDVLGRDRARYAGRCVAVLGAGHSAVGTLIDLARLKDEVPTTEIVWLLRGESPEKSFGGGAADQLSARGALGSKGAGGDQVGEGLGLGEVDLVRALLATVALLASNTQVVRLRRIDDPNRDGLQNCCSGECGTGYNGFGGVRCDWSSHLNWLAIACACRSTARPGGSTSGSGSGLPSLSSVALDVTAAA